MEGESSVVTDELSALAAIFNNDMETLPPVWGNPCVALKLSPYMSVGANQNELEAQMKVTFSKGYPRVPPRIGIMSSKGIGSAAASALEKQLNSYASKLANTDDMPIIYDLTIHCNKYLADNYVQTTQSFYDGYQRKMEDAKKEEARHAEEAIQHQALQKQELLHKLTALTEVSDGSRSHPVFQDELSSNLGAQHKGTQEHEDQFTSVGETPEPDLEGWLLQNEESGSRYKCDFEEYQTLGKGGFGTVVRAKNRLDGRSYAIKKLKLSGGDIEINRKTLREVTSLAKMFHPHIVRYYQAWIEESQHSSGQEHTTSSSEDSSEEDSYLSYESSWGESKKRNMFFQGKRVLYIQMEYCVGPTLRHVIDSGTLVPKKEKKGSTGDKVWKYLRQILEALNYVHETCMLIHRDLKPSNVFFSQQGDVKLGDFGLAVTSDGSSNNNSKEDFTEVNEKEPVQQQTTDTAKEPARNSTATENEQTDQITTGMETKSVGVGTALYRAPEVKESGKYDNKVDLFSLGVMLFEMLNEPFSTGMERHQTLTKLRSNARECTNDEIVIMLLQRDPKKRPSALLLLESGKLPNKIETEKKYFEEVMRVVKAKDVSSPLYARLVNALFQQPVQKEVFYLYDADLFRQLKHSKNKERANNQMQHNTLRKNAQMHILRNTISSVLINCGFRPLKTSLLTPKITKDNLQTAAQLLDTSGNVVELAMGLTRPFARWLAVTGVTMLKRFCIEDVYSPSRERRTNLGRQPFSETQACFDLVVPHSFIQYNSTEQEQNPISQDNTQLNIAKEKDKEEYEGKKKKKKKKFIKATGYQPPSNKNEIREEDKVESIETGIEFNTQIIEVAIHVLVEAGLDLNKLIIHVSSTSDQNNIFSHLNISDPTTQQDIVHLLHQHTQHNTLHTATHNAITRPTNTQYNKFSTLRKSLLNYVTPSQADKLKTILYNSSGAKKKKNNSAINSTNVLVDGVDFKGEVVEGVQHNRFLEPLQGIDTGFFFRIWTKQKQRAPLLVCSGGRYDSLVQSFQLTQHVRTPFCLSATVYLEKLAQLCCPQTVRAKPTALLCTPSDTSNTTTRHNIKRVAETLRLEDIAVDTVCPNNATTDSIVEFCKVQGIRVMVFPAKNNNFFRVRDVLTGTNMPDLKLDDLITYLKKQLTSKA